MILKRRDNTMAKKEVKPAPKAAPMKPAPKVEPAKPVTKKK